ncbi:MAG: RNA 2',3'-cyclic phosphodiesterase [Candidatus Moraniibacteriota bacterium]|nr:MAG: RNA 2',3'-cyclic phosphodiesterase [Candidatus Moranbacteria bacterium]
MKARKIFLGVRIPAEVARRLSVRMEKWTSLPLRLTKERNLHVTVLFLGFRGDEDISEIVSRIAEVCLATESFDVALDTIDFSHKEGDASEKGNMLWFSGEESAELLLLANRLEEALDMATAPRKHFRPHITLARIRKEKWEALREKPILASSWRVSIPVSSLTLFESTFSKAEGLHYEVLEEFPLGEE